MKHEGLFKFFLLMYIISIGFTGVLHFPLFGSKLQIPELMFIPLFLIWLILMDKSTLRFRFQVKGLEVSLILFLVVFIISSIIADQLKSWLETLGLIYLLLLFFVFKTSLSNINQSVPFIQHAFVACGSIAALLGITGWILATFGINNPLAWATNTYYPYLGNIGRAQGFMNTPNMLNSLLGVCLLVFLPTYIQLSQKKLTDHLILILFIIGILLTFSKSILLLAIAIIYIVSYHNYFSTKPIQILSKLFCLILFLICMAGSHVLILKKSNVKWELLKENAYTLDYPLLEFKDHYLILTNYAVNKMGAIYTGLENLPFGVDPGGFNKYLYVLRKEGLYPDWFPDYDPHSVYTGTFAELGMIGIFFLSFIFYQVCRSLKTTYLFQTSKNKTLIIGLTACFIFLVLDGLILDIINFRHLWVLMGILAMHSIPDKKE